MPDFLGMSLWIFDFMIMDLLFPIMLIIFVVFLFKIITATQNSVGKFFRNLMKTK